jgi:hypothetical protein
VCGGDRPMRWRDFALDQKTEASAADLKSLHPPLQARPRDFKSISGTRIMWLLVPFYFSKLVSDVAAMYHELRKAGTSVTAQVTAVRTLNHIRHRRSAGILLCLIAAIQ